MDTGSLTKDMYIFCYFAIKWYVNVVVVRNISHLVLKSKIFHVGSRHGAEAYPQASRPRPSENHESESKANLFQQISRLRPFVGRPRKVLHCRCIRILGLPCYVLESVITISIEVYFLKQLKS